MRIPHARLLAAPLLALFACAAPPPPEPGAAAASTDHLADVDPAWVRIYDPDRAFPGYTLDLYRRRIPMLLDLEGRIVHAWPEARVRSRVRLLPDGSVLAIGLGRNVVEYDWDGKLAWEARLGDHLPHHDVIRLANGNTLAVTRPAESVWDSLLELDRAGSKVWEWRSEPHLRPLLDGKVSASDITHVNSVQELPPNPWHDGGDARFAPGNLLVSARNMNLVFVLERATGAVVWTFRDRLDLQHEALMIGPGQPGAGNVLILSNGFRSTYEYRRSAILEVHPPDGTIVWSHAHDGFFTPIAGVEQPLPNGNVLVTSSRGGRVFELTRDGAIVWQWVPPFWPSRAQRYPYDHTPQTAALARETPRPVRPAEGYRHVDRPSYRFAHGSGRRTLKLAHGKVAVLKHNGGCRKVFLPGEGTLEAEYGLLLEKLQAAGRTAYAARVRMWLREESGTEVPLFEDTIELGRGEPKREQTGRLDRYAFRWVELCVETTEVGAPEGTRTEPFVYWLNPQILTPADLAEAEDEDPDADVTVLTAEERKARREQLKALGYVE